MKKLFLGLAIASLSTAAIAETTDEITFNGSVITGTCAIATESLNKQVKLPNVPTSALDANGKKAGTTTFNLKFDDCSAGTVYARFAPIANADSVDVNTNQIINTGTATNVGLELLKGDGATIIDLTSSTAGDEVTGTTTTEIDTADLNYTVQYVANGKATAGTVIGKLVYEVAYK